MKERRWKWIWLLPIFLLAIPLLGRNLSQEDNIKSSFDINSIDEDLSLSQALELYPEITEMFYIKKVSEEEVEDRISKGEEALYLNEEVRAREFLKSLR